ncbi:MAG: hypothetical protein EXR53_01640 [Dehalococcoidia bacterium]|nr:hypothetical protein [Dehalococcoidia bacterium]
MRISSRLKFIALMVGLVVGLELAPITWAQPQTEYQPPHQKPGPASERILFQGFHVDVASAELQAGKMDIYEFSLKTEAARRLQNVPDVKVYRAPASSISLILNAAPTQNPKVELNPFSIREVRFALQYAIDRRFIAQEIYKGLGEPMLAQVGPFDYDYLTVYDQLKEEDITYDPELARQMMTEAMQKAGASLQGGKWNFNGKPIQLKFIIRAEDERKDVGDLIASQLRSLGFEVASNYQQFGPAILTVYGTDPQLLDWHLYTEGWSRGSAERYDYGTINSMAAPWLGNMPGWQESGFWQYENPRLDELGKKLFQGSFQTVEERNKLYQEMTALSVQESVRLWLATIVNSLPATTKLQGVTQDISAGPRSIWTLREAYIPGKDTLTVGNLWVWTERSTWNPVGGFGDVYSNDIWQNVYDPPLWRHPFTGLPIPFRATYDVATAGPSGKLDVPADAFLWDAKKDAWTAVGSSLKATSKVTFDYSKYFKSNWHHGQPITMADVIYSIYQRWDMVYDENKSRIEFAQAVTSRPYLETIRGIRIVGNDKLEVYVDYWHFAQDYIAEYASLSGVNTPWEVLVGMDKLVFEDRKAAYSDTAAQRFNVPWISLVMDNDTRLLRRAMTDLRDAGSYPAKAFQVGNTSLVTKDDALKRYGATIQWTQKYGMAVISNGPFQLVRFDPPAQSAELLAFRDASYPFKPGDWYKGAPPEIAIETVESAGIGIGSGGTANILLQGPGQVEVRYLLFDPVKGKVVDKGNAQRVSATQYTIQLSATATAGLAPGPYQIFVVASSDQVSSLAERRLDIQAVTGKVTALPSPAARQSATGTPVSGSRGLSCTAPALSIARR